ncbi:MAG: GWxTD domain-containing protein [Candidatus Zhuqueibacterota bacterium]
MASSRSIIAVAVLGMMAMAFAAHASTDPIRFYTDNAGFKNFSDDRKTYQEIYISFANYQLTYKQVGDRFLAGYKLTVLIQDSTGKPAAEKTWQNMSQVDSLRQVDDLTTLELAGFLLQPGRYTAEIIVQDMESLAAGSDERTIVAPSFEGATLRISGIEFARSIERSEGKNQFTKNAVEVVPNPSRVFGIESPFVYFYTEIYHLQADSLQAGNITKEYMIRDFNGNVLISSRKEAAPGTSFALWADKINVLDLVSGKYQLNLKVTDNRSGAGAETTGEFWIHNPFKTISLAQYREEDIEEFRAQIMHITDQGELELFDQLNTPARIEFINNYWRGKDPNFRTEHLKRFYLASERFNSPSLPGWKSDRGRVFIMYGPPDEIEREPAGMEKRAYEVWTYETLDQQGQVHFVFCDFGTFGNYQLIHSNIKSSQRSEIYNENWYDDIKIAK